jgi:hypothetical protein
MSKKRPLKKKAARKRPPKKPVVVDTGPPVAKPARFLAMSEAVQYHLGTRIEYHVFEHNYHPTNLVATFYSEPLSRSYVLAMNALS